MNVAKTENANGRTEVVVNLRPFNIGERFSCEQLTVRIFGSTTKPMVEVYAGPMSELYKMDAIQAHYSKGGYDPPLSCEGELNIKVSGMTNASRVEVTGDFELWA